MEMNVYITPKEAWHIDPVKTALVVIDPQRAFLDKGAPVECVAGREIVPRINELASMCRRLEIPVIWVRQSNRADLSDVGLMQDIRPRQMDNELEVLEGKKGVDFYPALNVTPDDYVVTKIRYSAFIPGSSDLEPLLRGLGRDRFIICGVATDVCVGTTTTDAMMLGFKVFFVSNLTATLSDERQRISLEVLDRHFAKVMPLEQIKEELQLSLGGKE